MEAAGFDWDEGNRSKCLSHGVSIAQIEAVFGHPHRLAPDVAHSKAETRFLVIGKGDGERTVFVAFTFRQLENGLFVRPISARFMHEKEIEHYEQTLAQPEE